MGAGIVLIGLSFGLFTAKDMLMPPPAPVCKVEYVAPMPSAPLTQTIAFNNDKKANKDNK